jgi:hypothetical protein
METMNFYPTSAKRRKYRPLQKIAISGSMRHLLAFYLN